MTRTYRFRIDAFTPETIPMARLAEYMQRFAAILGHESAVHFAGLEPGSAQIVSTVDFTEAPKVHSRLDDVRRGEAPPDLMKLVDALDSQLAEDNAVGSLCEDIDGGTAEIIAFPGRNRPKPMRLGPFTEEGSLDGVLVSIGGVDDTVSLQLQNGPVRYTGCETTRDLARQLARHLFEPVRIHGTGRWLREADGTWTLRKFRVRRFDVLEREDLKDVVARLRAVEGSGWRDLEDPVAALTAMRKGETGPH